MRFYSDKLQVIQDHIMEHDQLARSTDPFLYQMAQTGQIPQGGPPTMGGQMMPPEQDQPLPQSGEAQPMDQGPEDVQNVVGKQATVADVAPDALGR